MSAAIKFFVEELNADANLQRKGWKFTADILKQPAFDVKKAVRIHKHYFYTEAELDQARDTQEAQLKYPGELEEVQERHSTRTSHARNPTYYSLEALAKGTEPQAQIFFIKYTHTSEFLVYRQVRDTRFVLSILF